MNQLTKEIELRGKSANHTFKALKPPIRSLLPQKDFIYITTYNIGRDIYNMDAINIYSSENGLLADIEKNWQHVLFFKETTSEVDAEFIKSDLILGNPEHDIAKKFK